MPTYKATATATASVTAQFFFRKEEVVTASGSATAESNISQEDAYNTALSIAKEVAQSAAQNNANVLIQSVNTSTLGDNSLFLSSSLLNDYFDRIDKVYTLKKDLELIKEIKLLVDKDETLNIGGKQKLTGTFTNLGNINQLPGSIVTVGGVKNNRTNKFNKYIKKATSTSDTTQASSNSGTYTVSSDSSFTVPSGETYANETLSGQSTATFTINSGGIVNNSGTFNNGIPSTTTGYVNGATFTINSGGVVNNYGIFNNGSSTDTSASVNIFGSFYFENNSVFYNYGTVNYESNNANFQGDLKSSTPPTYTIRNYAYIIFQESNTTLTVTTNGTLYSNVDAGITIYGNYTTNYPSQLGSIKINYGIQNVGVRVQTDGYLIESSV